MTQNRPPPAFQEYASSMMAKTQYRIMSLAARGLLYSMRLECWVNHELPSDPDILAKVLGFPPADVRTALPSVMSFFSDQNGVITCPELDDYRNHLAGINAKKSEGGKKGAATTNSKKKSPATVAGQGIEDGSGKPRVSRDISRDSLVKSSSVKSSSTQPPKREFSQDGNSEIDSFVADMERAERNNSNDYARHSNGF